MNREEIRDQVVTTTYILTEIMDNPSFIGNVDKAMDIAEAFILKFPLHTNWEKENWEESLHTFYYNYNKKKMEFEDILTCSFDEGTDGFINKRSELTGRIFMSHKDHEYEPKENKLFFECGPEIEYNSLSDSVYIYDYLDTLAKRLNINLYCGEAENLQSIKADNVLSAHVQYEELKQAIIDDGFEVRDDIY